MVRQGKVGKEVLGPEADIFLQYGQREKRLKETGSLEVSTFKTNDNGYRRYDHQEILVKVLMKMKFS